jgi:TfoX/Sxy family transcriptional regulator of competence genes
LSTSYDEELAHRIRELLGDEPGVSEMAMFGGLAFLLHGNMAVAASGQGGLLVRVDPQAGDRLLAKPHARAMEMRGRTMTGWIRVADEGIKTKRQLAAWVREGVTYAGTLPPKG